MLFKDPASAFGTCVLPIGVSPSATTINSVNVSDGAVTNTPYSALGISFDNPIDGSISARATSIAARSPTVVWRCGDGVRHPAGSCQHRRRDYTGSGRPRLAR